MVDEQTDNLISPEEIFKIIRYEDLKLLKVTNNDEKTLFFTEIDTLLKEAWTKREKFLEYNVTPKEKFLKDLMFELSNGGYTFTFKYKMIDDRMNKFILIKLI
jgi:hypothetical protein